MFIVVIAIPYFGNAQLSIGYEVGYSYNHLSTDISNKTFTKNTINRGYCTNLQINYGFSSFFLLQTGIGLIQKNYSFVRTDKYKGVSETFTNSYLQLPFTVQLIVINKGKFKVILNNGFYYAYWLFANIKGYIPNIYNTTNEIDPDGETIQNFSLTYYSDKLQLSNTKDNQFEFGFITGLNFDYSLNNKHSIYFELNYYQSVTDQQKKYMINQISKKNQTLCISVGYLMRITSEK